MENYNVGDLVSEFLYQMGIKDVFGVVSVHNIPMLDAIMNLSIRLEKSYHLEMIVMLL